MLWLVHKHTYTGGRMTRSILFSIVVCIFISYIKCDDSKCAARLGTCQDDSNTCSGSYVSNLCAGPTSRRCCVSSTVTDTIDCSGTNRHHAVGTGYFPDPSPIEGGYVDMRDQPLQTLQAYLEGSASIVTVAMDNHAGIAYDTPVCIPELNRKYGRFIDFRVRDTGSAFYNKGYSRIDICVRTEHDSFDNTINGPLTLVFH